MKEESGKAFGLELGTLDLYHMDFMPRDTDGRQSSWFGSMNSFYTPYLRVFHAGNAGNILWYHLFLNYSAVQKIGAHSQWDICQSDLFDMTPTSILWSDWLNLFNEDRSVKHLVSSPANLAKPIISWPDKHATPNLRPLRKGTQCGGQRTDVLVSCCRGIDEECFQSSNRRHFYSVSVTPGWPQVFGLAISWRR